MVNSEIMNANREYIIAVQTQHFVLCRSYLRVIFFCVCQKRLFCTIRRATYVSINPQLCSTMQTKHSLKSFFGCYMYFQDFLFSKYFIFKGFFVRIPFWSSPYEGRLLNFTACKAGWKIPLAHKKEIFVLGFGHWIGDLWPQDQICRSNQQFSWFRVFTLFDFYIWWCT